MVDVVFTIADFFPRWINADCRHLTGQVRALRDRVVATEFGPTFPLASQGLASCSSPPPVWHAPLY